MIMMIITFTMSFLFLSHGAKLQQNQLLSRFLAYVRLPRMSRLSTNDKDDNEMTSGGWHVLYYCGKPLKTSVGRPSDEGWANSHLIKWGPLPPKDIGRISQESAREKEEKRWQDPRMFPAVHGAMDFPTAVHNVLYRSMLVVYDLPLSYSTLFIINNL